MSARRASWAFTQPSSAPAYGQPLFGAMAAATCSAVSAIVPGNGTGEEKPLVYDDIAQMRASTHSTRIVW